jgi:coenzyme F420 hydrogenase subunit beta
MKRNAHGPSNIDAVVRNGLCVGCGVCAYFDAIGKMRYCTRAAQNFPVRSVETSKYNVAFAACPGKGYNILKDSARLHDAVQYDVELGRLYNQYVAYSNDKEVLANASSGGIMSQMAIFLLERSIVDRVLVTKFTYTAEPRATSILARSKADILSSQGSKYCPVDLSVALREIKDNNWKVAIIGTPCQIAGIRTLQQHDQSFNDKVVITLGTFCGGLKNYRNISLLAQRKGLDPGNITFFRFRGNGQPGSMLIEDNSGGRIEIPYPQYVGLNGISKHLRCHLCVDATAELADVACGDAWHRKLEKSAHPWSIVITRNKQADELVRTMMKAQVITAEPISTDDIKIAQRENLQSKKVRQKSRIYLYRRLGFHVPFFDGGYFDNKIDLWTEIKVFTKHRAKLLLEKLHLFSLVYRISGRQRVISKNVPTPTRSV